ncbi:MAG: hypothetical protein ACTSWY_13690 [Promethearchaeota archaeon]
MSKKPEKKEETKEESMLNDRKNDPVLNNKKKNSLLNGKKGNGNINKHAEKSDSEKVLKKDQFNIKNEKVEEIIEESVEGEETREMVENFSNFEDQIDEDEKIREMVENFNDLEDFDMEEMLDIQSAIQEVKKDESQTDDMELKKPEISAGIELEESQQFEQFEQGEISDDLAQKIKEELEKKKKERKVVTEEEFKDYCKERRNKIWYHSLWYLVFEVEDHKASKKALYEKLKETTSKSAIDPIPEHQFYFGLGFILRLKFNGEKIVKFKETELSLNAGVDILTDILREVGPAISKRPVITQKERKRMFTDFLSDNFTDI